MIQDSQAVLLFGSLELARNDVVTPYQVFAVGDDGSWGNPDPVIAVVDSLLGDGQLASVVRHNNREAQFKITVSAPDGTSLAAAEAALVAETERQNVLVWSAPDGYAPTTVFDVVTSYLEHSFDDESELRLERHYVLHLTLYPHSRSFSSTTVAALGSGITPTTPAVEETVSTCSSLTNWTGRVRTGIEPLTLESGTHLYMRATIGVLMWMRYTMAADQAWSDTPYLVVDWNATGAVDTRYTLTAQVGGPSLPERFLTALTTGPSPLNPAYKRSVFLIPAADANLVRYVQFAHENQLTSPSGSKWALRVDNVMVTDGGAANDGTARQLSRSLEIGGTARAMGIIDVRHENALGDVLVWSGPGACAPRLRPLRVSGAGETVDASLVSGVYESLASAFTADMPLSSLPSGAYMVMARLMTTSTPGTYAVDVTAQTRLETSAGVFTGVGPTLALSGSRADLTADYQICNLGVLHLPAAEVAVESNGFLRVTLQGANVWLDEAWLFNITDGDLTFVKAADKVLRITSPSLMDPRWRVWTGPSTTALYDAGSKMELRGQHLLAPGPWAAFTVTTGAQDAAVSLTYDKRWHTHAGEDG